MHLIINQGAQISDVQPSAQDQNKFQNLLCFSTYEVLQTFLKLSYRREN